MHFPTFTVISTLLAIASAAPTSPKEETNPLVKRTSNDKCGASTFINQSSTGSPKVSDCRQIAANFASGGTWTLTNGRVIGTYGTCAFGIMEQPASVVVLGNQDVIDVINDSISKFQWNGLVGSKGVMSCDGYFTGSASVTWGLYHT